jgi:hypothetical protein
MQINQPKTVELKMGTGKLRSGANWQGVSKQKRRKTNRHKKRAGYTVN